MKEKEFKKEKFIEKGIENKKKFEIHKRLIEKHLCIKKYPPVHVKYFEKDLSEEDKIYLEDLKNFAEKRIVDNYLLIAFMEYAENFHIEYSKLKDRSQAD